FGGLTAFDNGRRDRPRGTRRLSPSPPGARSTGRRRPARRPAASHAGLAAGGGRDARRRLDRPLHPAGAGARVGTVAVGDHRDRAGAAVRSRPTRPSVPPGRADPAAAARASPCPGRTGTRRVASRATWT